jgi:hypothetical protein
LAGQLLFAVLVFLFPLGLYTLALAYVNRARRPVLVPGLWDFVFLLFALSGFFLWTVPVLLAELFFRAIVLTEADISDTAALAVWLVYYGALAGGTALMLGFRRHKTAVYNVDTELLGPHLSRVLAELGLDAIHRGDRLVIAPAEAFTTPAPPGAFTTPDQVGAVAKTVDTARAGARYAEVTVDPFPTFCHATLHWDNYAPALRREVESRLAKALEDAAAVDNPAAGWFLGLSGLIFGAITVLAAFHVVVLMFSRHA